MHNQNLTVLAVDDDEDDLDIFCEAIRQVGQSIKCIVARSGEEALSLLTRLKNTHAVPNLIFLDHNMPAMNGRELFEKIKQDSVLRRVQVVMYSTFFSDEDKSQYMSQGAVTLIKPEKFSTIVDMLSRVISEYARLAMSK